MRDDVMHTVACKAAIKAGSGSERDSVMELIDKVMNGEVRYCPHGRPVSMELTKSQLDRSFKRA
jgi:DNA mismatch repair protein MutL